MSFHWRISSLLRLRRAERELDQELQYHFDQQVSENIAAGMTQAEAEHAARRTFGSVTSVKEECRETRGLGFLFDLIHDLRYALRVFLRSPGFAFAAVVTLALGIGANTTVFSIADAVMLKTLPVPEPGHLIQILQPEVLTSEYFDTFSFVNYREMQQEVRPFADLVAERPAVTAQVTVGGGQPETVRRSAVSGNYFQALGVTPALGRTLEPAIDNEPGRHAQAVIGYGFWKRRFNLDHGVIGSTIRIGDRPFEIVGVAGPGFFGLQVGSMTDIWTPVSMEPERRLRLRGATFLRLFGRLKPGVSPEQALAPLQVSYHRAQMERLRNAPPGTPAGIFDRVAQMELKLVPAAKGASPLRKTYGASIGIVFTVVAAVLLLACGNVANLLLARASARQKEMAIRVSLGAGRARLVRQLLAESLLLASVAAVAGLAVARWTAPVLISMLAPSSTPVQLAVGLDIRVLAFTAGIAFLTVVAFGVAPALWASRVEVHPALKTGARLFNAHSGWQSRWLLSAQMALSMALLLVSSLLVRTLVNLKAVDPGFDRHNMIVASVQFTGTEPIDRLRMAWERLLGRVSAIPGVESTSLSNGGPFAGAAASFPLRIAGRTTSLDLNWLIPLSSDYFRTMGARLIVGRDFGPRDFQPAALPVSIINETAAHRHFGKQNPLGQRIADFEQTPPVWAEIIGVAPDMSFDSLRSAPPPIVYVPFTQRFAGGAAFMQMEIRARRDSGAVAPALRREIAAADPRFSVREIRPFTKVIDDALTRERLLATVGSFFATLALLLASIGLYGTLSYSVARRRPEIGVRIALGAASGQVLTMVLGEAFTAVAAGAVIGIGAGFAGARLVAGLLFGVRPYDASTVLLVVVLLALTSLGAAVIPALRACRTDAMEALRSE